MRYSRTFTVRFSHCDPFGIAHYPRIVETVHDTSDMFMDTLGWSYYTMSETHGIGLPIVEVDFEFFSPLRAGDEVEIGLDYSIGASSLRFEYTGHTGDSKAFEGFEQRVCVAVDGDEGRPLPDELRAELESA